MSRFLTSYLNFFWNFLVGFCRGVALFAQDIHQRAYRRWNARVYVVYAVLALVLLLLLTGGFWKAVEAILMIVLVLLACAFLVRFAWESLVGGGHGRRRR